MRCWGSGKWTSTALARWRGGVAGRARFRNPANGLLFKGCKSPIDGWGFTGAPLKNTKYYPEGVGGWTPLTEQPRGGGGSPWVMAECLGQGLGGSSINFIRGPEWHHSYSDISRHHISRRLKFSWRATLSFGVNLKNYFQLYVVLFGSYLLL